MQQKAVILLSGGLDSATTLAIAKQDFSCYALSFNYGQRSLSELDSAEKIAKNLVVVEHKIISIDLGKLKGSALTDTNLAIPTKMTKGIPITYVPARNTIFLSFALAYAETINANHIFIGVNAVDYSGYPDCRQTYIDAFETMANLATKVTTEGEKITIHTPLIDQSKADIIKLGLSLNLDYSLTISCYDADSNGLACGACDSCRIRSDGFKSLNQPDPTLYQKN